jgi:hypothetical protein
MFLFSLSNILAPTFMYYNEHIQKSHSQVVSGSVTLYLKQMSLYSTKYYMSHLLLKKSKFCQNYSEL